MWLSVGFVFFFLEFLFGGVVVAVVMVVYMYT